MALPLRDYLYINPFFDSSGNEHPSECPMAESRKTQMLARMRNCFLRSFNSEDVRLWFRINATCLAAFEERTQLRVEGNGKSGIGLWRKVMIRSLSQSTSHY